MAFIRWQVDWNDIHPSGMERERETRQTEEEKAAFATAHS